MGRVGVSGGLLWIPKPRAARSIRVGGTNTLQKQQLTRSQQSSFLFFSVHALFWLTIRLAVVFGNFNCGGRGGKV